MRPSRTTASRRSLRAAALAGVALFAGSLTVGPLGTSPAGAAVQPLTDHSVSVTVLDVTPSTPSASGTPTTMTVTLGLTNTTAESLANLRIDGVRGTPINRQVDLDAAIAHPQVPDPAFSAPITPSGGTEVTASLVARGSATVSFATTTGTDSNTAGLCLCADAIYPLYFAVHNVATDGVDTLVGSVQTYLPAFGRSTPQPVLVSWVWPIIDRPHRVADDSVFIDDDLATSVNTGGRLDRVLNVVESVASLVPLTLVIDPELIDELQVMSTGAYQVAAAGTKPRPGAGGGAAAAWLLRLRQVLDSHPDLQVEYTAFADPDVEGLIRNNLSWSRRPSDAAAQRLSQALGGRPLTSQLAWPVNGALSADTLDTVRGDGASTVILNDRALPAESGTEIPDALAALTTKFGPVTAAVTSGAVQRYVTPVLSVGGTGNADLPKLAAEVAIRAAADPTRSHYVVITAPRAVDPAVTAAVHAILSTASTLWSAPVTVAKAELSVPAVDRGGLVPPKAGSLSSLPVLTVNTVRQVTTRIPALRSIFVAPGSTAPPAPTATSALLDSLPLAVQRAESAAWLSAPVAGVAFTEAVGHALDGVESGVFIVRPSTGTYTLASSNSPLPVAIQNSFDAPVWVRVRVSAVNDLPGFSAGDVGVRELAPHQTLTLHVPTEVQRSGRFQVQAQLYTPNGDTLGDPLVLSVHSTALGTIGIVITVVAGAVLVLALLVRLLRRLRKRGQAKPIDEPAPAVVP